MHNGLAHTQTPCARNFFFWLFSCVALVCIFWMIFYLFLSCHRYEFNVSSLKALFSDVFFSKCFFYHFFPQMTTAAATAAAMATMTQHRLRTTCTCISMRDIVPALFHAPLCHTHTHLDIEPNVSLSISRSKFNLYANDL